MCTPATDDEQIELGFEPRLAPSMGAPTSDPWVAIACTRHNDPARFCVFYQKLTPYLWGSQKLMMYGVIRIIGDYSIPGMGWIIKIVIDGNYQLQRIREGHDGILVSDLGIGTGILFEVDGRDRVRKKRATKATPVVVVEASRASSFNSSGRNGP